MSARGGRREATQDAREERLRVRATEEEERQPQREGGGGGEARRHARERRGGVLPEFAETAIDQAFSKTRPGVGRRIAGSHPSAKRSTKGRGGEAGAPVGGRVAA